MNRLDGKVALVIGSGYGIGKTIALAFAREGADVGVAGRTLSEVQNTAQEIEKIGRKTRAFEADITRLAEIDKLITDMYHYFNRIDILVNSAGIVSNVPVLDVKEADWDAVMNVHLKGVFFTIQRVLPIMIKQGKGKIINLASALGVQGKKDSSVYCTAKAGIINMTRALAVELGVENIYVNALAPGVTTNPEGPGIDPKMAQGFLNMIPLRRFGKLEEVSGAAIYLASDESDFTTGTTLFIDGGDTAH